MIWNTRTMYIIVGSIWHIKDSSAEKKSTNKVKYKALQLIKDQHRMCVQFTGTVYISYKNFKSLFKDHTPSLDVSPKFVTLVLTFFFHSI